MLCEGGLDVMGRGEGDTPTRWNEGRRGMMGEEGLIRTLRGGGELAVWGYGLEISAAVRMLIMPLCDFRGFRRSSQAIVGVECECVRIPMADVVVRVGG